MNLDGATPVFVICGFALVFFCSIKWSSNRSAIIIENWAIRNGFRVLGKQFSFWKGPYFFRSSKNQTVYRIQICDAQGRVRTGWVRCGSWAWGLMSDSIDVRWDE